jgi:small subunit ribosomal protein S20
LAEHKSVKKRHRQSVKARAHNRTIKGQLKTAMKLVEPDAENPKGSLSALTALLDKAVKRNIVHKNTAARKKSRLTKMLNKKEQSK